MASDNLPRSVHHRFPAGRTPRATVIVAALGAAFALATSASAIGPESHNVREKYDFGMGVEIGGGSAVSVLNGQKNRDVKSPASLMLLPHLDWTFADFSDADNWARGQFDGLLEFHYLHNFRKTSGNYYGGGLGLRYRFTAPSWVTPFAQIDVGLGGLDYDLEDQRDGFSFSAGSAVGARWPLNESFGLTTSARWFHISNGGTRRPNNGIDHFMGMVGIDWH
jgi:hypothetical protein